MASFGVFVGKADERRVVVSGMNLRTARGMAMGLRRGGGAFDLFELVASFGVFAGKGRRMEGGMAIGPLPGVRAPEWLRSVFF